MELKRSRNNFLKEFQSPPAMTFKAELAARGWMLKPGCVDASPCTHLFLDGGKAAVPDAMHGMFLNMYTNAILRGERLYVVETKTSNFKLFFDIDARYAGDPAVALQELLRLVVAINQLVTAFWMSSDDAPATAIVCTAPIKNDDPASYKLGLHVHWPDIVTNSPIALAFRHHAIEHIRESRNCELTCLNGLEDVLDSCVFKANGLRMVYSGKVDEYRAYSPVAIVRGADVEEIPPVLAADAKRRFIHDTSIRVFDALLTPCRNGIDKLADETRFAHSRHRQGAQLKLAQYAEVLPKLQSLLPKVYETQRFTGAFKTDHAVMLKSSSRYCQNVCREHRTSTVYFLLTRRGLAQRCYSRKDEHGCVDYTGDWWHVPADILDQILPQTAQEEEPVTIHVMPSKKRSVGNLHTLLGRCKPLASGAKKKKRR